MVLERAKHIQYTLHPCCKKPQWYLWLDYCINLFIHLYRHLSRICPSSVCQSIYIGPSFHSLTHSSVHLPSTHSSICTTVPSFLCLFIRASITCPSIRPSIHLSIQPATHIYPPVSILLSVNSNITISGLHLFSCVFFVCSSIHQSAFPLIPS